MLTKEETHELETLRADWAAWSRMTLEPAARKELDRLIELERKDAQQEGK